MIKISGVTISEKLEKFLRSERVYTKFCSAVNNPDEWTDSDEPGELDSISGSFVWSDTPDGVDFWGELNDKFYNK